MLISYKLGYCSAPGWATAQHSIKEYVAGLLIRSWAIGQPLQPFRFACTNLRRSRACLAQRAFRISPS
eukprot:4928353-Karenia_brevis.AAC.1